MSEGTAEYGMSINEPKKGSETKEPNGETISIGKALKDQLQTLRERPEYDGAEPNAVRLDKGNVLIGLADIITADLDDITQASKEKRKQVESAVSGNNEDELKQLKEIAFNLTKGDKVSADAWDRIYTYVDTHRVYWADQGRTLPEYSASKKDADANQSIYNSIHQALDNYPTRPQETNNRFEREYPAVQESPYYTFAFSPQEAKAILDKLSEKVELTPEDLETYFNATKADYEQQANDPRLKSLQKATEAAHELFKNKRQTADGLRIRVTIKGDEAKAEWAEQAQDETPQPQNGKYLFLPDNRVTEPMTLGYNEHQARQIDYRLKDIGSASEVINKIKNPNTELTIEETLKLTQHLDNHLYHLKKQTPTDETKKQIDTLDRMLSFAIGKLDKSVSLEAEKSIKDDEDNDAKVGSVAGPTRV